MEKKLLEDMFVDFILEKLGPTKANDELRNVVFQTIKKLILASLNDEDKMDFEVIPFGSFPSKLYINDSDLDITIVCLNKDKSTLNIDYEFLNRILQKIQTHLESDKNVSGVSLIFADVKIIKCKIEGVPIDISICNYVGLCKLLFMNTLEKEIFIKEDRIILFKRTLVLIKSWCYAESCLLGSNIGLMASYALECLVIYLFNCYNSEINSEFEGFCLFFEVMSKIKWENNILTIFGLISTEDFLEHTKNEENYEDYITSFYKKSPGFIYPNKIIDLAKRLEKFRDNDKTQIFNSNKKVINLKNINIIDPLFNCNNLGKSINYYNFTKIQKVFEITNKELTNLKLAFDSENKDSSLSSCFEIDSLNSPINYLNSLMKLFSRSMNNIYPELFYFSLNKPKIVIEINIKNGNDSDSNSSHNDNQIVKIDDVRSYLQKSNISSLNDKIITDFNVKFKLSKGINFFDNGFLNNNKNETFKNLDKLDKGQIESNVNNKEFYSKLDEKVTLEVNSNGSLYITREIVEAFIESFDYNAFNTFKDYGNKCDVILINKLIE